MMANDIPKFSKIRMRNGFEGVIRCAKKGNVRDVLINGLCGPEYGSVYVRDIAMVMTVSGWEAVMLSDKQRASARMISMAGF